MLKYFSGGLPSPLEPVSPEGVSGETAGEWLLFLGCNFLGNHRRLFLGDDFLHDFLRGDFCFFNGHNFVSYLLVDLLAECLFLRK